jgi:hypothetical protein
MLRRPAVRFTEPVGGIPAGSADRYRHMTDVPDVRINASDAMELGQVLDFLAGWFSPRGSPPPRRLRRLRRS